MGSQKPSPATHACLTLSLQKNRPDFYDVAIVGGGPSGSTCGFFLAKEGVKVAVLEKKTFPREKYCGDAVCLMAQRILKEMGVLQEIIAEGKAKYVRFIFFCFLFF